MKAKADFALGDLLLVWGISLPDEKQDMTEEEKVIRLLFYHAKSTVKF